MAKFPRPKPVRLPQKLKAIRVSLNFSQNEMLRALEIDETHNRSIISGYELGDKEPPLPILLKYARLADISTDVLIDDDLDLPLKLLNKDA